MSARACWLARGLVVLAWVHMITRYTVAAWEGDPLGGSAMVAASGAGAWLVAMALNLKLYLTSRGSGPALATMWFLGVLLLCAGSFGAVTTGMIFALGPVLAAAVLFAPAIAKQFDDSTLLALIPTPSTGVVVGALALSVVPSALLGDAALLDGSVASVFALTAAEQLRNAMPGEESADASLPPWRHDVRGAG